MQKATKIKKRQKLKNEKNSKGDKKCKKATENATSYKNDKKTTKSIQKATSGDPSPEASSGSSSASSTGALVGGSLRDPLDLEFRDASDWRELFRFVATSVDDVFDSRNRQRRFGDVCRDDNFSNRLRKVGEDVFLLAWWQHGVKRKSAHRKSRVQSGRRKIERRQVLVQVDFAELVVVLV